jgi:hypothetical protein
MQEWPAGSLEETVQNAIKTWEMELSHKVRLSDFKSVSPGRFSLSVNGGPARTGEETLAVGSYNALLASPILASTGAYDAAKETFASSHDLFRSAFPRGLAWEVLKVYSGPPVIVFKFRHWGHMEGPYKGHAATGEKVEFHVVAVLKVILFVMFDYSSYLKIILYIIMICFITKESYNMAYNFVYLN